MEAGDEVKSAAAQLRQAGCIAAEDEAALIVEAARVGPRALPELLRRRCSGEPLAWLLGWTSFCGERVFVHPGVFVPRPQSGPLALLAAERLPQRGVAVDLCTGSGAIALVLKRRRPHAHIIGTEIDPLAAACAEANGIEVHLGDMADGVPGDLQGLVDVVTAVVPYVPTADLGLLPRDVLAYEPRLALHGGGDGTALLRRAVLGARALLRPGGSLLIELGAEQGDLLTPLLLQVGYSEIERLFDEEDDLRGLASRLTAS